MAVGGRGGHSSGSVWGMSRCVTQDWPEQDAGWTSAPQLGQREQAGFFHGKKSKQCSWPGKADLSVPLAPSSCPGAETGLGTMQWLHLMARILLGHGSRTLGSRQCGKGPCCHHEVLNEWSWCGAFWRKGTQRQPASLTHMPTSADPNLWVYRCMKETRTSPTY